MDLSRKFENIKSHERNEALHKYRIRGNFSYISSVFN
ncbi:hypothetical protein GLYMA_10G206800v4 [Glycine max]|uniref:Uncharacterized protein n=1 Tax=Glycine max TaxID=3847 RepID=A0A0R0I4K7_SOYBN|nr:hypothetical protein GYH30_028625 [Glycine max]KRH34795.1 hypothetical protein GLYMA_10G206800v4 [Glycine max]